MKEKLKIVATTGLAILFAGSSVLAAEADRLDAPTLHEDEAYSSLLYRKLIVTPADCGRMIVAPPFSGESAISIYSSPSNSLNQKRYFITLTNAESNLYQAGAHAKDVAVKRIDAEIPEQTALSVQNAWLEMLRPSQRNESEASLDGQTVEFSIERPSKDTLYGDLPNKRGPRTEEFWQLGTLLTEYALAEPSKRSSIMEKIRRGASALTKSVKAEK